MSTDFEHFVYGWSEHGLEGSSRFQVVAASQRIGQAFVARSPLLDLATRLAYWEPAPSDPSSRVFGWEWTRLGLFVFIKQRLTPGHWAAPGGFLLFGFHTVERPRLDDVCALLAPEVVSAMDDEAARGRTLAGLPRRAPRRYEPAEASELAEHMAGAVLSNFGGKPIGLVATSEQIIEALHDCAGSIPLPLFTTRSMSTSEAPQRARSFGLVGIGPNPEPSSYPDVQRLGSNGSADSSRALVRVSFRDPARSRNAIAIATSSEEFDTNLFTAVLQVLNGDASNLTRSEANAILSHPDAADMALLHPPVRVRLAELVTLHWNQLGQMWTAAADNLSTTGEATADLAAAMLRLGFPQWTDGGATVEPGPLAALCDQVADIATGQEASLRSAPTEIITGVLGRCRSSSARTVELRHSLIDTLATRYPTPLMVHALSRADMVELATRWWEGRHYGRIAMLTKSLDARSFAWLADLVATPSGQQRLDQWIMHANNAEERDLLSRFVLGLARRSPIGDALLGVLQRVPFVTSPAVAALVLSERIDAVLLSQLADGWRDALGRTAAAVLDGAIMARALVSESTQLTDSELELARLLSVASVDCLQLHRAAIARHELAHRRRDNLDSLFDEILQRILGQGDTYSASAVHLTLDGFMEAEPSPDQAAMIVEAAATALGSSPAAVWRQVFWVFDKNVRAGRKDKREAWAVLFIDAVRAGARRGHFGSLRSASSRIGDGMPSELRELVRRWER